MDIEQAWTPGTEPMRPLTRKQQAFVRHLIENPKDSATKAALATYGKPGKPTTYGTARDIASTNLAKPSVKLELAKYSGTAELVLMEVLETSRTEMRIGERDRAQWAANARQTADSILDRVHGKATQRVENQSQAVVIHVDLTGSVLTGDGTEASS